MPTNNYSPSLDTFVRSDVATQNRGSEDECEIQYTGFLGQHKYRAILVFDLSDIPSDATIDSASLTLDVTSGGGNKAGAIHRITQDPSALVESEITWDEYASGSSWTSGGVDFDSGTTVGFTTTSSTGLYELPEDDDLVTLIEDAIENRDGMLALILKLASESGGVESFKFASKEHASAAAPDLEVTYTEAAGSNTEAFESQVASPAIAVGITSLKIRAPWLPPITNKWNDPSASG